MDACLCASLRGRSHEPWISGDVLNGFRQDAATGTPLEANHFWFLRVLTIDRFLKRRVQGGKQAEDSGEAREHCGTERLQQCQCETPRVYRA